MKFSVSYNRETNKFYISLAHCTVELTKDEFNKIKNQMIHEYFNSITKTDIVEQVCDELGHNLIVSHSVEKDWTDYKGMPFVFKKKG